MIPLSEAQLKLAVKYILSSQTMFLETKEELKKKKKSSEKSMYLKMWQIIDMEN